MAGLSLPADRFEVGKRIGIGGESVVVEARDNSRGEIVAVKVPADRSPEALEAFHRSSTMHELVRHPNVVSILEHDAHPKSPFLVMERLEGQTLAERLASGPLPEVSETVSILAGVAAGLEATHAAGVVHRDVKPENVMLMADGGVKILDYGLAAYQDLSRRDLRAVNGTPGYIAPERIRRESGVPARRGGPKADLYGLGALGYELLCGAKPFTGTRDEINRAQLSGEFTPLPVMTDRAPRPLAEMVHTMLSVNPNLRPASASLVLDRLNTMASGDPDPDPAARTTRMQSAGFGPVPENPAVWRPPCPRSRQAPIPEAFPRTATRREPEPPSLRPQGNERGLGGPGDGPALR